VKPRTVRLPDSRVWLRVADPEWADPLDPSYARRTGGRWNPPGSVATLYLNGDVVTARLQIERLLAGSPVRLDDLDDEAYILVAAMLPRAQMSADATSEAGLRALQLPKSYPCDPSIPGAGGVGQTPSTGLLEICDRLGRPWPGRSGGPASGAKGMRQTACSGPEGRIGNGDDNSHCYCELS
jgi:RES domain-containing protein